LIEGLFLAIIATSRVGPSLSRNAAQRTNLLGCPDLEFVVAMAFGDGVRFSIGLPTPDPEEPSPVIGAR
jgi:hypothetical protein